MRPFIGVLEAVCGALVPVGLFTRLTALLLIADMTIAILPTKVLSQTAWMLLPSGSGTKIRLTYGVFAPHSYLLEASNRMKALKASLVSSMVTPIVLVGSTRTI